MFSELIITDGTTIIDLTSLSKGGYGIGIDSYTPGRVQPKDGGSWRNSPISPGRRLVFQTNGNVQDTLTLKMAAPTLDELNARQEELDLLLMRAMSYWTTDWQEQVIYLQAISLGETARRYAIIYGYTLAEYPNPFGQLLTQAGNGRSYVSDNIQLTIERSPWMGNIPGEGTTIEVSNDQQDADTQVVIGNYATAGLAAVMYSYFTTGQQYGLTNLLTQELPVALFNDPVYASEDPTEANAVYFGCTVPFSNLMLNLTTPIANATGVWEWCDNSEFFSQCWNEILDVIDDSEGLTLTGPRAVAWPRLDVGEPSWTSRTVGTFGPYYWVRFRLNAQTDTVVMPEQGTHQFYIPTSPYIEIADDQIPGNMDALAMIRLRRRNPPYITPLQFVSQDIIMGLRSIYRAGLDCSNFNAYINMDTDNNPVGITIALNDAKPGVTQEVDTNSPTQLAINYAALDGEDLDEIFTVTFASSISRQYYGRYRLFVRYTTTDYSGNALLRATVKYADSVSSLSGPIVTVGSEEVTYDDRLSDLGYVTIPPTSLVQHSELSAPLSIVMEAVATADTVITFYNLILMPVDEWTAQVSGEALTALEDFYIDVDSIHHPRETLRAVIRGASTLYISDTFPIVANQEARLHAGVRQRLWFLFNNTTSYKEIFTTVSIEVSPRFYNLRSD